MSLFSLVPGPGYVRLSTVIIIGAITAVPLFGAAAKRVASYVSLVLGLSAIGVFFIFNAPLAGTRGDAWLWPNLDGVLTDKRQIWLSSAVPMWVLHHVGPDTWQAWDPWFALTAAAVTAGIVTLIGLRIAPTVEWNRCANLGLVLFMLLGGTYLFVVRYYEMYPAGATPALLAVLAIVLLALEAPKAPPARVPLLAAGVGLMVGIAASFHLENLLYLPAALIVLVLVAPRRQTQMAAAAACLAGLAGVLAIVFGALAISGHHLVSGNAGGARNGLLDPHLLSKAHLKQTATIVLLAAWPAPALLRLFAGDRRRLAQEHGPLFAAAGLMAASVLAFWCLWGFDYGLPGDLDLAMSVVWGLVPILGIGVVQSFAKWPKATVAAALVLSAASAVVFSTYTVST